MSATRVNVENFVRAESDRMFASFVAEAGGVNVFNHRREPTAVEHQPVIRMNRDTLYSAAIVDISGGATVTIPDSGVRRRPGSAREGAADDIERRHGWGRVGV